MHRAIAPNGVRRRCGGDDYRTYQSRVCRAPPVHGGSRAGLDSRPCADRSDPVADIVVTAERRETKLQQTPLAISVVGGGKLQTQRIVSILDLNTGLLNVTIGTGLGGQAQINIRGIGYTDLIPGGEARVAYYVDGVYVAHPSAM